MYQSYLLVGLIIVIVAVYGLVGTNLPMWLKTHCHRNNNDVLVDEEDVLELLESFGWALTTVEAPSPFTTNTEAMIVRYVDTLGRVVAIKTRWMDDHYYYMNEHWLDIVDAIYEVNETDATT